MGRLKSLMLKCPIHELPKKTILTNFYDRLSRQDKEMLDASSSGVFQTKSVEERWDLLERIQKNTEDWEIDKGIMNKSERRTDEPEDQIKVDPRVALVKDLITNDALDFNINFCAVSPNLVTAKNKGPISGTP